MLSIVIPAYNEAQAIGATLAALREALDREDFPYEVVVVDDGSADATATVLAGLAAGWPRLRTVRNEGPHGYGHAVRRGLAEFRGEAVVVAMADGSDAPGDLVRYYRAVLDGADCAFGTRFSGGATVQNYPRFKLALNRLGNWLISALVGRHFEDWTNGFKCFRRWVVERMQPLVGGEFNLTVEMSIKAALTGARIVVIPNDWRQREAGESKFRTLRLARLYLMTVAYCLLHDRLSRGAARR